jgi:hypothetical protein
MIDPNKTKVGWATIVDYGQPEYLDGAQMQFSVEYKPRKSQYPQTAAYFGEKEHAEIFARALNEHLRGK